MQAAVTGIVKAPVAPFTRPWWRKRQANSKRLAHPPSVDQGLVFGNKTAPVFRTL